MGRERLQKVLLLVLCGVLILMLSYSPRISHGTTGDRSAALKVIDSLIDNGGKNELSLTFMRGYARSADYNCESIARIAELAAGYGYHTLPLIQVARLASETEYDCRYFAQIGELVIRHISETGKVVDLAEQAKAARTESDLRSLEQAIARVDKECELKTLADAQRYEEELRRRN